ncbi:MAG: anhydro-N-acetylmuramic acid kinase [Chitinophagaceae bacterium]
MIYRVIGTMSGSSLDGLDIVFAELEESGGKWSYEIKAAACYLYDENWMSKLQNAIHLNAYDYLLLHSAYGKYCAEKIHRFIEENNLHHQIQLIASHGHTVFHAPQFGMTAQLGDGATIAAITQINVVSDLRSIDVALGGEGAPIVPIGEKLFWENYSLLLNLGGIANISASLNLSNKNSAASQGNFIAFDVCPANRILNMLVQKEEKEFDKDGNIARSGLINNALIEELNRLDYYKKSYPKSLSNNFGTEIIFPLIQSYNISTADSLRTYVEHIAEQIKNAILFINHEPSTINHQLLVTGGGAFNIFLIESLKNKLQKLNVEIIIPDSQLIKYKEALIMALLGVLRWREENTVLNSVTGASRSSIGGAVWIGQEA